MNSAADPPGLPPDLTEWLATVMRRPPSEWSAAIEAIVREQPEHAEAVLALLQREHASRAPGSVAAADAALAATRPEQVGPYRILASLGVGGMGEVFLAARSDIGLLVALKVIKPGMDTRAFLARFEAERSSLARMEHTNIARVLDAGATADGRPYFVMELVRGVPINRYCDDQRLSIEDRLELFQQVCAGVQHAHNKGVLHRDLTANNVLVTVQDGRATAKIIDFGLARATDRDRLEHSVFTEQGVLLGTPEYMSPEQAGLGGLDIDTRTDVYSLGVLLYELLSGELPFPREELRAAGYDGMCRTIREREPVRPSTRVTQSSPSTSRVAELRRTEPHRLLERLRGDLDWIILKCLEKDRTRRYDTPTHLADDLRRHLEHEPVQARPPSAAYRLRKLARRYRKELVAAGVACLSLGVGGTVAAWSILDVSTARASAKASQAEALSAKIFADTARRERDLIAATADAERLQGEVDGLYPMSPASFDRVERFLVEADSVLALEPALRTSLDEVVARAEPWDAQQQAADRATHRAQAEWQAVRAELEARTRAARVRRDPSQLTLPALTDDERERPSVELRMLGWPLVDPNPETRAWGDEAHGLALAQRAEQVLPSDALNWLRVQVGDLLAWAQFANGLDEQALAQIARTVAIADAERVPSMRSRQALLQQQVRDRAGTPGALRIQELRARFERLDAQLGERRTFRFHDDADRRLHPALRSALGRVLALRSLVERVRRELSWARSAVDATALHPKSAVTWESVAAAMARADGTLAHPAYRSLPPFAPPFGLVPIGFNPTTKLLELYDLRSAWDSNSNAAASDLEIPRPAADGTIAVGEGTGLVFVLLPGGDTWIGAQDDDPAGRLYDPAGGLYPRRVHLDPFLLSRYEMTQGQYLRLSGKNPSSTPAGRVPGEPITLVNPVEQVTYDEAVRVLARYDLTLPTEAQWEYACRAGTTTPFSCAFADLARFANLKDRAWWREGHQGDEAEAWDDERAAHARVGSFGANAFGLHDMHGNVFEWTADGRGTGMPRPGDGLRAAESGSPSRVFRGGAYTVLATEARSAFRAWLPRTSASLDIGLRPLRRVLAQGR